MKTCTWNIKGVTKTRKDVWDYFLTINPDIALLQEVDSIPEYVASGYSVLQKNAIKKDGTAQHFSTAILVKGKIEKVKKLYSTLDWVNKELELFDGNIVSAKVMLNSGLEFYVISVYSPAWPINKKNLANIDVSGVKLENNPDVWLTEILYSALSNEDINNESWIVAGDLNSSVTFDETFSSGNQEIQDRMSSLGFTECLKSHNGRLIPTFKNAKGGKIIHQMDHVFVTKDIYKNINYCEVAKPERIFDELLSDHLPIIADFKV